MSDDDALQELHNLLKVNTELLEAQNKANLLKEEELKLKSESLKLEQDKIDLERQHRELQRQALNRAETRLQEVLQRYAGQSERIEILISYAQKNLFKDDAFRDVLAAISERFETFELAIMLALMEKLDSPHVQNKGEEVVGQLGNSLNRSSKQRQLMAHYKNLNILEERLAEGDDSLPLINKRNRIKEEIERLEQELGRTGN
jgi:hypothetical protein